MILISACLAGKTCRYDGKANTVCELKALYEQGQACLICPEVMGGLGIPREPCELQGSRVISCGGTDCTAQYQKGAEAALKIAQENGVSLAVLKARSPSCGCRFIYDGSFTHTVIPGDGLTARLLQEHGIRVIDENEWKEEKENSQIA